MGTVARQEKIGDSCITISFENYEDFLDYQKKEREQDALDCEDFDKVILSDTQIKLAENK